jgi:SPP1 gp7 family putative phage head morphogenesis protein
MTYSKRQQRKILQVGSRPFIAPDADIPYSMRVSESLIRRRLYALEDEAVVDQYRMMRTAYNDIRNRALDLAQQYNVSELSNTANVVRWRRDVDAYTQQRAVALSQQIAYHAIQAAGNLYLLGYYGRAWSLDMSTKPDMLIRAPVPSTADVTRDILQPGLTEAWEPDRLIYDLLGVEWRQQYADNIGDMVRKIRNTMNTAIQNNLNVQNWTQLVADAMGVNISKAQGFKSAFNRIQALTRTYAMTAANEGALALYNANSSLVEGVEWLAANDARVCPTCARLNGMVWLLGDSDMQRPPAHVNCRCTIIPRITSLSIANKLNTPPAQTWKDWILAAGLGWLLGSDLTDINLGDDIDSSQIGDDEAEYEDVF